VKEVFYLKIVLICEVILYNREHLYLIFIHLNMKHCKQQFIIVQSRMHFSLKCLLYSCLNSKEGRGVGRIRCNLYD